MVSRKILFLLRPQASGVALALNLRPCGHRLTERYPAAWILPRGTLQVGTLVPLGISVLLYQHSGIGADWPGIILRP